MHDLPEHIPLVFGLTAFATAILVFRAARKTKNKKHRKFAWRLLTLIFVWLILQGVLSLNGLYSDHMHIMPPYIFLFGVLPTILLIVWLFASQKGKDWMDGLSQKRLTYIHVVRIPVELVLWWLSLAHVVPEIMTFEGWNYDILSGITALLIVYFGYRKKNLSRGVLLAWNVICLGLVLFILSIGLLSAPFPFQQLGVDQPNIAVLYFPFVWLPTFVVPSVVLAHLIVIRQLVRGNA